MDLIFLSLYHIRCDRFQPNTGPSVSPNNVHGSGSGLEEVCRFLDGANIAEDSLPDVL